MSIQNHSGPGSVHPEHLPKQPNKHDLRIDTSSPSRASPSKVPPRPTAPLIPPAPPLSEEPGSSPSSGKSIKSRNVRHKKELEHEVSRRQYGKIRANYERAISPSSKEATFDIHQLAKTQNFVGIIGGLQFISKNEAEIVVGSKIRDVGVFYSKDEIISGLRTELARRSDDIEESESDKRKKENLIELIKVITAFPGLYITLDIDLILKNFTELSSKIKIDERDVNDIKALLERAKKGCVEYVSTAELQVKQHINQAELNKLTKSRRYQEPKFVLKTGSENVREELGAKLVNSLGLSEPLLPKSPVSFPRKSESFLAGEFVDRDTNLDMDKLDEIAQLQFQLNAATSQVQKMESSPAEFSLFRISGRYAQAVSNRDTLAQQVADRTNLLREKVDVSDMHQLCLTDLLFQSTDSHSDQFLRTKDGHFHNIDFARFLPPNETFRAGDGGIIADFRCCWLDYPAANQEMSVELQQRIAGWNIDEIEEEWRGQGLLYTQEEYTHDKAKLFRLKAELEKNMDSLTPDQRKDIAKSYGLTYSNRAQLRQDLNNLYIEHRRKCFAKVGPHSLKKFKERVVSLQTYIEDCRRTRTPPTPRGAFAKMYPDFVPFLKAKDILMRGRGGNYFSGETGYRTLESFIQLAKQHPAHFPQRLVEEMEDAYGRLKRRTSATDNIDFMMTSGVMK